MQEQTNVEVADVSIATVVAGASKYKEMTLSECAKFDAETGQRDKLTGWGAICKARYAHRKSKRGEARRQRKGIRRVDEAAAE